MVKSNLLALFSVSLLLACQGADMAPGGLKQGFANKDAEADLAESPQETPPTEPTPASSEEYVSIAPETAVPEPAISPIMVGGAYLICKISLDNSAQAECLAFNQGGSGLGKPMEKAFILSGSPAIWFPASFKSNGADRYLIDLPAGVKSDIGFAMIYDKNQTAFDWVSGTDHNVFNLVKDGSFEHHRIANGQDHQHFDGGGTFWRTTGDRSGCADTRGVMELQNAVDAVIAPHGTQWAELDSKCPGASAEVLGNTGLYQSVSFLANHHYMIRFDYARRQNNAGKLQRLNFSIHGKTIFEVDSTVEAWQQKTLIYKPDSDLKDSHFKFREIGDSDRMGTLIDDIQVIDLGEDKQLL